MCGLVRLPEKHRRGLVAAGWPGLAGSRCWAVGFHSRSSTTIPAPYRPQNALLIQSEDSLGRISRGIDRWEVRLATNGQGRHLPQIVRSNVIPCSKRTADEAWLRKL